MTRDEADKIWRLIVDIHNATKSIFLKSEELERNRLTWLHVIQEQRNALEHIIRAKAYALGLKEEENEHYERDCLDKALGHTYRAFFDAADTLGIYLRDWIQSKLIPYKADIIVKAFPEYHKEIAAPLMNLSENIATVRDRKDIARGERLDAVKDYLTLLDRLLIFAKQIEAHIPLLEQHRRGRKFKEFIFPVLLVLLAAFAGWFLRGL